LAGTDQASLCLHLAVCDCAHSRAAHHNTIHQLQPPATTNLVLHVFGARSPPATTTPTTATISSSSNTSRSSSSHLRLLSGSSSSSSSCCSRVADSMSIGVPGPCCLWPGGGHDGVTCSGVTQPPTRDPEVFLAGPCRPPAASTTRPERPERMEPERRRCVGASRPGE